MPLHALVINVEKGYPGGDLNDDVDGGYWTACGSSKDIKGWAEVDVMKCIDAENLPRIAPELRGIA